MHPSGSLDWQRVLNELALTGYEGASPEAPTWLGDSPEMSEELTKLVIEGTKQGTASLLAEWEYNDEQLPSPGTTEILLNWNNSIAAVIENVETVVVPFKEVTPQFAYLEGEGDRSLEYWRKVHAEFFEKVCERIEEKFTSQLLVVCETFRVLYVPEST